MPTRTEQREREDHAKLEWLRAAAKEGFDAIERGDYVTLRSDRDIEEFMRQVGEDASTEVAVARQRGRIALPEPLSCLVQPKQNERPKRKSAAPSSSMPPSG